MHLQAESNFKSLAAWTNIIQKIWKTLQFLFHNMEQNQGIACPFSIKSVFDEFNFTDIWETRKVKIYSANCRKSLQYGITVNKSFNFQNESSYFLNSKLKDAFYLLLRLKNVQNLHRKIKCWRPLKLTWNPESPREVDSLNWP